jgi:ribose 5-phosphate isomerase B
MSKKDSQKKVIIANDHAGLNLKRKIFDHLPHQHVIDLGVHDVSSCDYPKIAEKLCDYLKENPDDIGILICGTGIGMSIKANRYPHIRASLCHTEYDARMAREHNNANVLCLGERCVGDGVALSIVDVFLNTMFSENPKHLNRVNML